MYNRLKEIKSNENERSSGWSICVGNHMVTFTGFYNISLIKKAIMKNHFLSRFDTNQIKKTIILFVLAALFIAISLLVGTTDNLPMIAMLFIGIVLFFYAVLYLWRKSSHYAILCVIFLILFILLLLVGIDTLVKMENAGKLRIHMAEGIAMSVGFICVAGVIAGIIGIFSFMKHDKLFKRNKQAD